MYGRGSLRYFIGFGLTIFLLIFAIILIVHHGGGKGKVPETQKVLTSYADDSGAAVKETLVGPINAQSQHDEVQITVTNSSTTFELDKGYDGNAVKTKVYPMDQTSFAEFLYALDRAGFTVGNTTDDKLKDDRGYCSTGTRYIFEALENGNDTERFWTSSCGSPKTFKGNTSLVLSLFQAQVPDYDSLTENTNFSTSFF
jgi:hypothetical protein